MLRLLPQDQDHALLHFYRAVRDAMDAGQIGSPCSHERLRVTRASLRGSVALLERVAMREVRGAFRQLQRAAFGRRPRPESWSVKKSKRATSSKGKMQKGKKEKKDKKKKKQKKEVRIVYLAVPKYAIS
eukprot:symbB.v1.2.018989.t1/scaffold1501.1/size122984/1